MGWRIVDMFLAWALRQRPIYVEVADDYTLPGDWTDDVSVKAVYTRLSGSRLIIYAGENL